MTRHQDFDKIKVGDIIDFNDSSTGYGHAVFVIGLQPTTVDSFLLTNGNVSGNVRWNRYSYVSEWSETQKSESYVYSRY